MKAGLHLHVCAVECFCLFVVCFLLLNVTGCFTITASLKFMYTHLAHWNIKTEIGVELSCHQIQFNADEQNYHQISVPLLVLINKLSSPLFQNT